MNELLSAANDFINGNYGAFDLTPAERRLFARVRRICEAYLSEHLADGDEPVTEEWLRSIGADHRLNGEWLIADPRTLDECMEVWCIFTDDGGPPGVIVKPSYCEDAPCIIANCTRSQLRKLLEALGVK